MSKSKEDIKETPTPTKLEVITQYTKTHVWVLNPDELDLENMDWEKAIIHNEGDEVALIWMNPETDYVIAQSWYKNGKRHRSKDQPAVIYSSGSKWWYKDGLLHRKKGSPAYISADGTEEEWINGKKVKKDDLSNKRE